MALGKVYYTGETNEYIRNGEIYDVTAISKKGKKKYYGLRDVEGSYISSDFEDVYEGKLGTYIAIAPVMKPPKKGGKLENFFRFERDIWRRVKQSSEITEVKPASNGIYEVHTQYAIYYIQNMSKPAKGFAN